MNCMCLKPTYLSFYQGCVPQVKLRPPYDEEILHGKKADRFCERCGRGLCGDCCQSTQFYMEAWERVMPVADYVCQACKEDLK